MQMPDNTSNSSYEQYVRYVFQQLSAEEEADLERSLDANPEEADTIDAILNFCYKEKITSYNDYQKFMSTKISDVNAEVEQRLKFTRPKRISDSIGYSIYPILLIGILIIIYKDVADTQNLNQKTSDPNIPKLEKNREVVTISDQNASNIAVEKNNDLSPKLQRKPPLKNNVSCKLLDKEKIIWLEEFTNEVKDTYVFAGERDTLKTWQEYLISNNCDEAIHTLELSNYTSSVKAYSLGVLYLLCKSNPEKAIDFLIKGKSVSRPKYNKYLLQAYLENGRIEEAKVLLEKVESKELSSNARRCLGRN